MCPKCFCHSCTNQPQSKRLVVSLMGHLPFQELCHLKLQLLGGYSQGAILERLSLGKFMISDTLMLNSGAGSDVLVISFSCNSASNVAHLVQTNLNLYSPCCSFRSILSRCASSISSDRASLGCYVL